MRILLLGATGRTGKQILAAAIEKGYRINCLVREPKKIEMNHEKVAVFKGSPKLISDLEKALEGCEVIISALNISRKSDFPWSKLRTPPTFLSDVMQNIISLSEKQSIKRIVVCSAWGVSETKKDIPFWFKWFIDNSNIGVTYKDHERQEKVLKSSNLDWTIVRPTGLVNSKKGGKIIESYGNEPKPRLTISRFGLAKFMLDLILDKKLIHCTLVVSEGERVT
ncbi:MAG: hypothetical protein COA50_06665 [Flavobacteriaceae bacterium]|nr:MAG: hypothetical protein COA50_06665 [Flavobacteriaceae bacterium]